MNNKNSRIYGYGLFILIVCFLLAGCQSSVSPEQYMSWAKKEENGLMKIKKIGSYKIRCQYKPIDFIILSEKKKDERLSQAQIDKKKSELEGMQYYDLYVGNEEGDMIKSQSESETDFYNRMYYYSFGFENDIKLIEGADTLSCELYHFERDYDLGKEKRFLLGFEKKKDNKEDKTLYIDSKVLGMAIVKIQIKNKDIQNTPEVRYETNN